MLPEIILEKVNIQAKLIELSLFIPHTIKYFDGHFPKHPVLPGVVQVDWVLYFIEKYLNIQNVKVSGVDQLKFTQVILPDSNIDVKIQLEENKITFQYYKDKVSFSSGKIIYT